jgi:hypothetical protein
MDGRAEKARNAAALLSTTGALVLGFGLGALLGRSLGSAAWLVAAAGLAAHLWGMAAGRRVQRGEGHRFARWETWAYWLCWVLIALGVAVALGKLLT